MAIVQIEFKLRSSLQYNFSNEFICKLRHFQFVRELRKLCTNKLASAHTQFDRTRCVIDVQMPGIEDEVEINHRKDTYLNLSTPNSNVLVYIYTGNLSKKKHMQRINIPYMKLGLFSVSLCIFINFIFHTHFGFVLKLNRSFAMFFFLSIHFPYEIVLFICYNNICIFCNSYGFLLQ